MNLQDFNTLAEAQAYEEVTYKVVSPSTATSFFLTRGVEDVLHANQNNATEIDANGVTLTVGSICRGALNNATGFNFDPSNELGQSNIALLNILVGLSLITQEIADQFTSLAETVRTPFANKTQYDFDLAKDTVLTKPVSISANGDYAIMSTSETSVAHSPRITTADGTVASYFRNVSNMGTYVSQIQVQYKNQELFVDDVYGVII